MTADEIMALADVLLDETQPQFKAEQAHAALRAAVEQLCRAWQTDRGTAQAMAQLAAEQRERAERAERERDELREKFLLRDKPPVKCKGCGESIAPWRTYCVPCADQRISDD